MSFGKPIWNKPFRRNIDMGNFTLSPTVFRCLSSKKRRNSVTGSSISSGYTPTSSSRTSVASSTSSLTSTASSSSQRKLVAKKDVKTTSSNKVYKSSPFCGPTVFSKAKNGGYSSSAADLAALQAYRFAGR